MTRILTIWLFCIALVIAEQYPATPIDTTEKWACPICGQCLPDLVDRTYNNFLELGDPDSNIYRCYPTKVRFAVDLHGVTGIIWCSQIDSIHVVKADSTFVTDSTKTDWGWFYLPRYLKITKAEAETTWTKGRCK